MVRTRTIAKWAAGYKPEVNGKHSPADDEPDAVEVVKRDPLLEFVRLDHTTDSKGNWVTKRSADPVKSAGDEFSVYSFAVVRDWIPSGGTSFTVHIEIKSPLLKLALQDAMGDIEGLSWNSTPLQIVPRTLLAFYPDLVRHLEDLPNASYGVDDGASHLRLLVNFLGTEHSETLSKAVNALEHEEITFDLLWCLLVPRTILYMKCPVSSQPRAVRLLSAQLQANRCGDRYWSLSCEYTDMSGLGNQKSSLRFGYAKLTTMIPEFEGTISISSLPAYPLKYHADMESMTERLIDRGVKWMGFDGIQHVRYDGTAFTYRPHEPRVTVASRIMIDKGTYRRINPNDRVPDITKFDNKRGAASSYILFPPNRQQLNGDGNDPHGQLTEEQLLLTTPLLYGFSLSDKMWLVFNIDQISEIQWQEDAFNQLVLPDAQKSLIKGLVESHRGPDEGDGFDDFIMGKGRGLIINLFGPPGVGKTLSAEATSEYVRKPLYVVGVGEIGTDLERKLKEIFDVACVWKAIVLIDEADVFMEERSVHDLARNALVAVFLRQLEYYQGILFLTTNRVKVFDEAFQSRIHISLHYRELSVDAKRQIWTAFFDKAGMETGQLTSDEWQTLTEAQINGRQIKNAVRSCQGLAASRGEAMSYKHLEEVLTVMEQFAADLKEEREDSDRSPKRRRLD